MVFYGFNHPAQLGFPSKIFPTGSLCKEILDLGKNQLQALPWTGGFRCRKLKRLDVPGRQLLFAGALLEWWHHGAPIGVK